MSISNPSFSNLLNDVREQFRNGKIQLGTFSQSFGLFLWHFYGFSEFGSLFGRRVNHSQKLIDYAIVVL